MRDLRYSLTGLALLTVVAACGSEPRSQVATDRAQGAPPRSNIVEVAVVAGQFSTLLRAVEAAGLKSTLEGDGPFTVFAPTDGAFAMLPEGTVEGLLQDRDALQSVLLYHVVPGRISARELREKTQLETVQGKPLTVAMTDQGVTINGTYLLTADVPASNGVIHVITSVLVP